MRELIGISLLIAPIIIGCVALGFMYGRGLGIILFIAFITVPSMIAVGWHLLTR